MLDKIKERAKRALPHMWKGLKASIDRALDDEFITFGLYGSGILLFSIGLVISILLMFVNTGGYSYLETIGLTWLFVLLTWSGGVFLVVFGILVLWVHYMFQTVVLRKSWRSLNVRSE